MLGSQKPSNILHSLKKLTAEQALKDSLVDEICSPEDDIVKLAKNWIITKDQGTTWDNKRFKVPGTPLGVGQISGVTEFLVL
jgi:3-hydroxyacyl-CoA dehydrogenase/enoyl-CoA hydratase/3-hydroxybutyryl-CoA epimerase